MTSLKSLYIILVPSVRLGVVMVWQLNDLLLLTLHYLCNSPNWIFPMLPRCNRITNSYIHSLKQTPPWNGNSPTASQKIPTFYDSNATYSVHCSLPLDSTLSQLSSPQSCNLFLHDSHTYILHSTRKFDPSAEVWLNSSHTIFTVIILIGHAFHYYF
jgi:hypothetical protein